MINYLLMGCNAVLAVSVGACVYYWTKHPAQFDDSAYQLDKMKDKPAVVQSDIFDIHEQEIPYDEMKIVMESKEIFHPDRILIAGNATPASIAKSKINAQMSLIGTFSVGDSLGAIIVQKLQGNGAQLLKQIQAEEYEAYQLSARRTVSTLKDEVNGTSETVKTVVAGEGNEKAFTQDAAAPEKTTKTAITATNIFRQCLKVGDETINGYTLVEVTRTSATLVRKKESITLSLLSPTEARDAVNKKVDNKQKDQKNQQNQQKKK